MVKIDLLKIRVSPGMFKILQGSDMILLHNFSINKTAFEVFEVVIVLLISKIVTGCPAKTGATSLIIFEIVVLMQEEIAKTKVLKIGVHPELKFLLY